MMKFCWLFIVAFFIISCSKKTKSDLKNSDAVPMSRASIQKQTVSNATTNYNWQVSFKLTHNSSVDSVNGKPVKFYIENKKCDSLAIAFYLGSFRPSDDEATEKLLALTQTDDLNLRPFYRWILDKTIEVSDGALAEYVGIPARKYAEKFPKEFFTFMDKNATENRYDNWTEAISYSGFYENEEYKNPKLIREHLESIMLKNGSNKLKNRIAKFSLDCFPNLNKRDL